jgi:pantoate--beta-alanine ligase
LVVIDALETLASRREVFDRVRAWRAEGLRVGFVPTMGALHAGHLALVEASLRATYRTIVSIFVNPLQFGPNEDLEAYPRPIEHDRALLRAAGAHALYLPTVAEMYPPEAETRLVQTELPKFLCGGLRPGHFEGVLTVVLKLFLQVRPHVAFFGRKDYQQTVVLRRMTRDLDLDLDLDLRVEPTVREADGLALSSRNIYLSPEDRAKAPALKRALDATCDAFRRGVDDPAALLRAGRSILDAEGAFQVEYFALADPDTLRPRVERALEGDLVAVAARLRRTRLIDNVELR